MKRYFLLLLYMACYVAVLAQPDPDYPPAPAPLQNIVAAEYFIDTDPGYGSATPIAITPGVSIVNAAFAANTSGLSNGVHRIVIRTRSNEGRWSIVAFKDFLVDFDPAYSAVSSLQNIVSAEYFIDTDPGFGNGTAIAVTPGTDVSNIAAAINVSGFTTGIHRLYIRAKSIDGKWSITNVKDFLVNLDFPYAASPAAPQQITAAEYFMDTDPGFGNGTAIPFTPGVDINSISFNANTSGLSAGTHRIYVRTRSMEGRWSIVNIKEFLVDAEVSYPPAPPAPQHIVRAEYFVDTDPGHGNGNPISVSPATDINNISFNINTAILTPGEHRIYVRTLNAEGKWSLANNKAFNVGQLNSWVIEPAAGHDFGNVATGSSSSFNFTIRNTGNFAITLNEVSSSSPAFVPTYTSGTIIAVGGSINLPVSFYPAAVTTYNAVLKIKSATGGPDSVTTVMNGTGFSPATPPVLSFVAAAPYSGLSGVNPSTGQTGNYTYQVHYRSADNREPAAGYPKVGIDLNGDQDFDDAGEGMFTMNKEGSSTDYAAGVTYTYTANYSQYSNTMGYRFFANDALGNAATGNNIWYAGPVVTYELLDLKLFANDISFSKSNPLPGESFTLTATITNNSSFTATNVPVNFYRDTILIGSTSVPLVSAFGTTTVTRTLAFGADGFYPIKVWIDPDRTLNENNVLNNYAIRPVVIGSPVLPGGITVTGSTSVQNCPSQKIIFTGHAEYFGTATATAVAGATVTINTGSSVLTTTTDVNGYYNLVMENPPCGNMMTYTVSVTDFTFTSNTFTGAQQVDCPSPNACTPPPANGGGGIKVMVSGDPCANVAGGSSSAQLVIKYRGRNPANMWGLWDKIWKDTVKVFNNGVLIQTLYTNDIPDFGSSGTFPGDEKIIPVSVPLSSAGPNNIEVVATYVYNEFFQNETPFYHGVFIPMTATASTTIFASPDKPDLTLGNFTSTSLRSFTFDDINKECIGAGMHLVRIVDITNPLSPVTVQTNTVPAVGGKGSVTITANFPNIAPGTHQFRIVTDTTSLVSESNEDNNIFLVTMFVPQPDLSVLKIIPSTTDLPQGAQVSFNAIINNTGFETGPFTVRFLANGVPIGNDINVSGIGDGGQTTISSNLFTVPTAETDCPIDITVVVDAGTSVNESNELNNSSVIKLGADIQPLHQPGEFGSASNPVRVRVNTLKQFNAYIRNTGTRDIHDVTVRFMHNGTTLGTTVLPLIKAGIDFPAVASFTHTFTTAGDATVDIVTDTANLVCEISEANNTGPYHIVVTESKEDYVVLSQYISPGSLNPNAGQNITIAGTVKNIGNRIAPASVMRFYVDDIPLGAAVPFNGLQIGQDTTVAATVTYSSPINGLKVVKITVDEDLLVAEEDETNNEATRIIIVGDAPDMTRAIAQPISFNPNGFNAGDSVTIAYQLRNAGTHAGSAWVRFKIFDGAGSLTAIDSVAFMLQAGNNLAVSKRMLFIIDSGFVVTEIVNCTPFESNLLNNTDTLYFSTVAKMTTNLVLNNLDMKAGAPQQLPGWIGGKIVLGDYDLTVTGNIVNYDTAHFFITNGNGRLKIANSNQQNVFPVGVGLYQPNFTRINNMGAPDNFSVRVLPYVLRYGTNGDTIRTSVVGRTWMIEEETAGGSNANVEMSWKAADELAGFDRTDSKVAHYTSSWQFGDPGNATVDTNGIFSRAQAGYTGFSPFTVTSGNNVFLPLRFIDFTATPAGKDVLLKWTTESEINTSHFDVEFSTDGAGFAAIGKVNSMNTAGQHRYEFLHRAPGQTTLYYRIRQVDLDGHAAYSRIVRVKPGAPVDITLAPNPAANHIRLMHADISKLKEIRIVAADGKTVQRLMNNLTSVIDIQHLKNGLYIVQMFGRDGSMTTIPFAKQ